MGKIFENITKNILRTLLILGLLLTPLLFSNKTEANPAGNVQFTSDTIIDLTGNPQTLYTESGSECDLLQVSGSTLTATIGDAQNFTLKTATYKVLKLTPSGGSLTLTFDSANFSTGYISQWTEESATPGLTTAHIVGVPKASTNYAVLVQDSFYGTYQSSAQKEISFTYDGGYTARVFKIREASTITSTSETWDYCVNSRNPWLNWTVSGGSQVSYWVQINDVNSFDDSCTGCEVNTGEVASTSNSYPTTYNFNWNTTYYWRVKVKESNGFWSIWANDSDGFITPKNAYPSANFTYSPATIRTNDFAYFKDASTCSDADNTCDTWLWTFEGATGCCLCSDGGCSDNTCLEDGDTCSEQGTVDDQIGVQWKTKPSGNDVTVTLEVCDGNTPTAYCCSEPKNIPILYYPKWKEIKPWQ